MILTIFLIAVTVIISVLAFNNLDLFNKLKFNAVMVTQKKDYSRLFSHALIHADWMHLIVNMFVLYSFGQVVETSFSVLFPAGNFIYVLMYVLAVPFASIPSLLKHKNNVSYNSVGASGAVMAVLFASILLSPNGTLMIFPIPIPIKSWIFGIIYLGYSYFMSKKSNDNIAHDAHFAGAIFGFIFPIIFL